MSHVMTIGAELYLAAVLPVEDISKWNGENYR